MKIFEIYGLEYRTPLEVKDMCQYQAAPILEENARLKAELELQREKNTRIKAIIDNEYAEGYEKNRCLIALLARAREHVCSAGVFGEGLLEEIDELLASSEVRRDEHAVLGEK